MHQSQENPNAYVKEHIIRAQEDRPEVLVVFFNWKNIGVVFSVT